MSARDRSAARILATPGSADFDDVGALLTAMRHMLDSDGLPGKSEARSLYVLAVMAEAAWKRLDDAMSGTGR